MLHKERAIAYVAIHWARRWYDDVHGMHESLIERFIGFGDSEESALEDAIASGRTSPVTLADLKHGCMTDIWSTPYGIVMFDQG